MAKKLKPKATVDVATLPHASGTRACVEMAHAYLNGHQTAVSFCLFVISVMAHQAADAKHTEAPNTNLDAFATMLAQHHQ